MAGSEVQNNGDMNREDSGVLAHQNNISDNAKQMKTDKWSRVKQSWGGRSFAMKIRANHQSSRKDGAKGRTSAAMISEDSTF
jgi:hypothetical protein